MTYLKIYRTIKLLFKKEFEIKLQKKKQENMQEFIYQFLKAKIIHESVQLLFAEIYK